MQTLRFKTFSRKYGIPVIAIWTFVIGLLATISVMALRADTLKAAESEARNYFSLNLFYRAWNSNMGGVYAPVDRVPPNPYLQVSSRDISASNGQKLTLINPAYMTRMVFEAIRDSSPEPIINKLTSLKPINPVNAPDEWEKQSLEGFERRDYTELSEVAMISGRPYLRYISMFVTEESCLKCHAQQGYQKGDIRGGIAISVPLAKRFESERQIFTKILGGYFILWTIGSTGILWSSRKRFLDEEARARLEEQLFQSQKMESVGRLAGGVAHDFNNMLSIILGHAEMGLMYLKPESPLAASLNEISKAAQRSAELTRQLLSFARNQPVIPKIIEPNEAVSEMLKMLQRLIGENIRLSWNPAPDLWQIRIDSSQFDQIIANLCVNARDAIKGTGMITISTENIVIDAKYCITTPEAVPGDFVRLRISDDGQGMGKETISRIFEPFYTTKEIGRGTGLGLSTVYGSVKQNNGFINVSSEPGKGTTFSIYLPRHRGNGHSEMPHGPAAIFDRGDETILLVEDETPILEVTTMLLQEQGYTVLTAKSSVDALQVAKNRTGAIHLLMTDVIMPEMNGRDLAKQLLLIHPAMKVLFMSGYTADIIAHHGVLEEGVHFIQKPFNLVELAAKVRQVLNSRNV